MNNDSPFFSIIIPVYNVAPYLRECLDSVLAQTFTGWEAVCVDDGSTDGSGAILDEYAAKDPRFKAVHQKNAGEGAARNTGLEAAKGRWLLFLDGDDILAPESLARLAHDVRDCDVPLRFGYRKFPDGSALEIPAQPESVAQILDISSRIAMEDFFTYVVQYAYPARLVSNIKFKKYKRGCDRVFLSDVLLNRADALKIAGYVCYGYRTRAGSAMNSLPSAQVLRDEMDHRLDIMEMIDASGKDVPYAGDRWLEKYFTKTMYWIVRSRETDMAEVERDWRDRLKRLRKMKGLSRGAKFFALTCPLFKSRLWDWLLVYAVPRYKEGGSPVRFAIRKMKNLISRVAGATKCRRGGGVRPDLGFIPQACRLYFLIPSSDRTAAFPPPCGGCRLALFRVASDDAVRRLRTERLAA